MGYRIRYGIRKEKHLIWPLVVVVVLTVGAIFRGNLNVQTMPIAYFVQMYRAVDSFADELGGGMGWENAVSAFWDQLVGNENKNPI